MKRPPKTHSYKLKKSELAVAVLAIEQKLGLTVGILFYYRKYRDQ